MTEYRATSQERFWSKVQRTPTCWLWVGYVNPKGYGRVHMQRVDGSTSSGQAHRIAYELAGHSIPEGLVLDHRCRVRNCVNPEHLEPVTNRENVLRGIGPSALAARKTHCPQGHEYSPENTYIKNMSGGRGQCRLCRTCDLAASARRYARRNAKEAS